MPYPECCVPQPCVIIVYTVVASTRIADWSAPLHVAGVMQVTTQLLGAR
jgi:hypothetical protein